MKIKKLLTTSYNVFEWGRERGDVVRHESRYMRSCVCDIVYNKGEELIFYGMKACSLNEISQSAYVNVCIKF